ncbi:hypothetical protein Goari_015227, partial [Gossypium aridum]|nr:hypothetical protein [Gossypium aridum]
MMVGDYGNFSSLHFESKELDDKVGVPSSENDLLELVVSLMIGRRKLSSQRERILLVLLLAIMTTWGRVFTHELGTVLMEIVLFRAGMNLNLNIC